MSAQLMRDIAKKFIGQNGCAILTEVGDGEDVRHAWIIAEIVKELLGGRARVKVTNGNFAYRDKTFEAEASQILR